MIPGAGTTRERQIYTYIDKTAKPNVIYYYEIECISEDGTRQILRRSLLKGPFKGPFNRLHNLIL